MLNQSYPVLHRKRAVKASISACQVMLPHRIQSQYGRIHDVSGVNSTARRKNGRKMSTYSLTHDIRGWHRGKGCAISRLEDEEETDGVFHVGGQCLLGGSGVQKHRPFPALEDAFPTR